jgi:GNAT superfamily N-acetyltransferase
MFAEAGFAADSLAAMAEPFRRWLAPRLADERYFGWIIECDGAAVAGLGMIIIEWPPHPAHPTQDRRGYVLNVFVEPAHRSRGLATRLMMMAREEARRRGIGFMVLHTTALGRPVYERLGWTPTTEMAIAAM